MSLEEEQEEMLCFETRENLREKMVQNIYDLLKSGVRGDEFEEERLERNAVIPFEQKEGQKTFSTLNKKKVVSQKVETELHLYKTINFRIC